MLTIYTLKPRAVYVVKKSFTDYYGNEFAAGEKLTYVEKHFLPYDGGHTVCFKERNVYLQEERNADIIGAFGDYLAESSGDD